MSTPDKDTQPTFADTVNTVVGQMTQSADGKWQLPDNITDEAVIYAANAERRRRDTQSAYTKAQQELARKEAENNLLAENWQKDFSMDLSVEQRAELEELKVTDPDAWRAKLNELEQAKVAKFKEVHQSIQQKAVGETELQYRQRALQEFSEANPDLVITDDVIKNDIPPRITRELEEGKISFGDFLNKVAEYMGKGRVIKPSDGNAHDSIDLAKAPGGSLPDGSAIKEASKNAYEDEIY